SVVGHVGSGSIGVLTTPPAWPSCAPWATTISHQARRGCEGPWAACGAAATCGSDVRGGSGAGRSGRPQGGEHGEAATGSAGAVAEEALVVAGHVGDGDVRRGHTGRLELPAVRAPQVEQEAAVPVGAHDG